MKVISSILFFLGLLLTPIHLTREPLPIPPGRSLEATAAVRPATRILERDSSRSDATASKQHILESLGKLPLRFEANQGQTDGQARFISHSGDSTVFLTATEAVLCLPKAIAGSDAESAIQKARASE